MNVTNLPKVKLPKQWKHWCAVSRLRPQYRSRKMYDWFYLVGHGHVWRVNCYNQFQIGDTYDDFDRWALCKIYEIPTPKSLNEFRTQVKEMLRIWNEDYSDEDKDQECPCGNDGGTSCGSPNCYLLTGDNDE